MPGGGTFPIEAVPRRAPARFGTAALLAVALTAVASADGVAQDLPLTGAERGAWERSTTHAQLMDFLWEVQARSERMLIQELGVTNEGRPHPVVFLGDPPLSGPSASLLSGKPTLLILASIHGNERSGKEGAQQFIRELALETEGEVLERVNVIVVPHMNPDGGDARRRTNSLGYDLNRDWIAAETREVSFVLEQILNRFAPDVFVDAHNGGAYPYHLTYQATLDPTADSTLVAFARGPMYEAVRGHLEGLEMLAYWYSGPSFDAEEERWYWRTTVPWPRKQHSYGGLRNMITLLFEVPGRHSLEVQADVARESFLALARFVAEHDDQVRRTVVEARRRTIASPPEIVFELEPTAYPEDESFLVARGDSVMEVTGENRTLYEPGRTRPAPWGYAFDGRLDDVAVFLRRHGIQVETLREEAVVRSEDFRILSIEWADEPYQNHLMASVEVEVVPAERTLPAGSYLVRLRQPEGRLIPQLLEPDAVDSVLRWNFLDHSLPSEGGEDAWVPIYRLSGPPGVPTALIP